MQSIGSFARVPLTRECRHRLCCPPTSLSYVSRAALSTTASSFFRDTSGRSRRRARKRGEHHRRGTTGRTTDGSQRESTASSGVDNRTVWDLLFPDSKYDDGSSVPPHLRFRWPTSLAQWRTAFRRAWHEYRSTWKGFWTSRGFLVVEEASDGARREKEDEAARDTVRQMGRDVNERATRNALAVQEEVESLRTRVRDATGIHSTDDLKRWVGEVLQLFSDCVKEFMAGYRKGRDDEVEKMLTEYFQELEKSADSGSSRKRRKRKRREVLII